MSQHYSTWTQQEPYLRMGFVSKLLGCLANSSKVLELGCGSGRPVAETLAERFHLTAVDISTAQLELASRHVPEATFIRADMTTLDFQSGAFDAVVSLYSMTHVPRVEHGALLGRIADWLRLGGYLLINMGAGDLPDSIEDDWLGVPMFFSHFDAATNRALISSVGLEVLEAQVVPEEEKGRQVKFLWVVARKPSNAIACSPA